VRGLRTKYLGSRYVALPDGIPNGILLMVAATVAAATRDSLTQRGWTKDDGGMARVEEVPQNV